MPSRREFLVASAGIVAWRFLPTLAAATPGADHGDAAGLRRQFADPPREFGFMPLWFWNDDLTDAGLEEQIREFHAKGFGGFIIHPRVGLSRRVGYLTPEFFRLVRVAVEAAARRGMKVVLYDEAGYPAGSARGRVVAENPDWAAKCLFALHHRVAGPAKGFWRPNPGRALNHRLVSVVLGRETGPDRLDPASLRPLPWDEHELVAYDLPEGNWRIVALWEGHSGGNTRGAFAEEEDGHALAPPAADILRQDAVEFFLRVTHDEYWRNLRDHFGTTIVAMFTDEPTPMGRIFDPVLRVTRHAWTPGFLDEVRRWWPSGDAACWLAALWLDCGPQTEAFRSAYRKAVQARLERTYYLPVSRWCTEHGIALTGHPAHSNEMGTLRRFQWPGQDLVWRMVVPNSPSALTGADSLTAKAASSAAVLGRRRFNIVEIFGAYGWQLNFDEIKWLLDWHLVRGTNLFFPHAAFYSIRGRRAFESEPDVGVNNVWWPHFGLLGDYARRLCWLFTDGELVCPTAVLSDGDQLSWRASGALHQAQHDFIFLDGPGLEAANVEPGRLNAGRQQIAAIVVDEPGILSDEARRRLDQFAAAGGAVLRDWTPASLAGLLDARVGQDVAWQGGAADALRVMHYRKAGLDFFLLVNEGESDLRGRAKLRAHGAVEAWNALDGSAEPWPARPADGGVEVPVDLPRRAAIVFAVGSSLASPAMEPRLWRAGSITARLDTWQASPPPSGGTTALAPGDWARMPGWEKFSGTVSYTADFELPRGAAAPEFIDLGRVGDIAEVFVNDRRIGVAGWAPYVLPLRGALQAGVNHLEVRVTNSMANTFDGRQLPSGLIGPVVLRSAECWS